MNTLYLLGGPPRTAKTAIMTGLMTQRNVPCIPADAVEHGLRNVFTGMPHQMLRNVEFSGAAEHKASIGEGGERKLFSVKGSESELTLTAMLGMVDYYGRANSSVAFEGSAITPAWVANLDFPNFTIRAAFVGYTNASHADSVISYAKENSHDWINEWLESEQGDETKIREWIEGQAKKCLSLKAEAGASDYPFFDISTQAFEGYVHSAQNYFLDR
jgi:hypothetical protein